MKRFKFDRIFPFIILISLVSLVYFQGCAAERRGSQTTNQVGESWSTEGAQKVSSVAEARGILQESSRRIAELVRQRPGVDPFKKPITPLEKAEQERIDHKIAAIQRERAEALRGVVLAENPKVQIVDQSRGIYRLPINDGQGRAHWFSGSITPIWHLQRLNPAVFDLAEAIRSRPAAAAIPPDTKVTAHLWLAGTSSQSMVHPYPGDID
jgi:hypothetical protein